MKQNVMKLLLRWSSEAASTLAPICSLRSTRKFGLQEAPTNKSAHGAANQQDVILFSRGSLATVCFKLQAIRRFWM